MECNFTFNLLIPTSMEQFINNNLPCSIQLTIINGFKLITGYLIGFHNDLIDVSCNLLIVFQFPCIMRLK